MPGLSRSIVEHRLPIKPGYRPHAQLQRKYNSKILGEIKYVMERMTEAGFIKPCRYATWISNIDYRNLNKATPKDEYPMPLADMLVDAAAGHKMMSFLDGNAGYIQIFMAEDDVYKTAF